MTQEESAGGFAAVPNWLVRDDTISGHAKLVFMVLSSHAGRAGTWAMTHRQIAAEAGLGVTSVKAALTELRELGVVGWVTPDDPKEAWMGASYTVTMMPGERLSPRRAPPTPPSPNTYPPDATRLEEEEPKEEPKERDGRASRLTPKRGTRVPDPFELTDDMLTWAGIQGFTPSQARKITEAFVDYWRAVPGARGVKLDWPATWRNWLRRERTPNGQPDRYDPWAYAESFCEPCDVFHKPGEHLVKARRS